MGRKDNHAFSDRVKSIIRHIENVHYAASQCPFHFDKPCFMILNNFDYGRFHCLYANQSIVWKSVSINSSCDVPEHFYDLHQLSKLLGTEYVLPLSGYFRESSGYTVGMFRQPVELYSPNRIKRENFKETVYAFVLFLCAVGHQLGGNTPNIKHFSFLYTNTHPVLCDIGSFNVDNRERLSNRKEHFNEKKWVRFMCRKTTRDVIRYLRIVFPTFFQKKKEGKHCILNETDEECFDSETHNLVCRSNEKSLALVLQDYMHLMPNESIRTCVIQKWIDKLKDRKIWNRDDKSPVAKRAKTKDKKIVESW